MQISIDNREKYISDFISLNEKITNKRSRQLWRLEILVYILISVILEFNTHIFISVAFLAVFFAFIYFKRIKITKKLIYTRLSTIKHFNVSDSYIEVVFNDYVVKYEYTHFNKILKTNKYYLFLNESSSLLFILPVEQEEHLPSTIKPLPLDKNIPKHKKSYILRILFIIYILLTLSKVFPPGDFILGSENKISERKHFINTLTDSLKLKDKKPEALYKLFSKKLKQSYALNKLSSDLEKIKHSLGAYMNDGPLYKKRISKGYSSKKGWFSTYQYTKKFNFEKGVLVSVIYLDSNKRIEKLQLIKISNTQYSAKKDENISIKSINGQIQITPRGEEKE